MKLPKASSHHLDNHFLLFAFYLDLIIFHLQQHGNHKLHRVPDVSAEIKHAEKSASGKAFASSSTFPTAQKHGGVLLTLQQRSHVSQSWSIIPRLLFWKTGILILLPDLLQSLLTQTCPHLAGSEVKPVTIRKTPSALKVNGGFSFGWWHHL